jgi:hypothetical protein
MNRIVAFLRYHQEDIGYGLEIVLQLIAFVFVIFTISVLASGLPFSGGSDPDCSALDSRLGNC